MVEWEGVECAAAVFRPSTKNTLIGAIAVLAVGALGIYGLTQPHDVFLGILSAFLVVLGAGGVLGVIAAFRARRTLPSYGRGFFRGRSPAGASFPGKASRRWGIHISTGRPTSGCGRRNRHKRGASCEP